MQSDVVVGEDAITGTLKYVTGYTGWTSEVAKQEGNFLSVSVEATEGATIEAYLGDRGPVDITEDGYLVARIVDVAEELKFVVTKGETVKEFTYSLADLVLETE